MKLIAIDLDGTLLNSDHLISNQDLTMIKKAQSLGVKFIIATGRTFNDAKRLLSENNLTVSYIASSNGTIIQDFNGEILYEFPVDKSSFEKVISFLYFNNYFFSISTNKGRVSILNSKQRFIGDFYLAKSKNPTLCEDLFDSTLNLFFNINQEHRMELSFNDLLNIEDDVFCICAVSYNNDKLDMGLTALKDVPTLSIFKSAENNFELTNTLASKGQALKLLAKDLDIPLSETMAIGDNENDISMITSANIGVSMGNAKDIIKSKADFITLDNNSSGVSYAIEKYLTVQV